MNRWLDGIKGKIKKGRNTYFPVFFFFYSFVRTLQILHGLLEVFGIFLIFWMDMKFQTFAPNLITFWKMFVAKMAADMNIIAHCRSIYIRNSGVLYALSRVKSWSPPEGKISHCGAVGHFCSDFVFALWHIIGIKWEHSHYSRFTGYCKRKLFTTNLSIRFLIAYLLENVTNKIFCCVIFSTQNNMNEMFWPSSVKLLSFNRRRILHRGFFHWVSSPETG